ncbi:MAG: hypothetical protein ACC662_01540 [Planctomycetota bacterium]
MTDHPPSSPPSSSPPAAAGFPAPRRTEDLPHIIVRSYPKVIFFWLTWVASLVAGFLQKDFPGIQHLGTVWLCIFAFNLLVISFDFTEVISVLVLALIGIFVIAGLHFGFLGAVGDFFKNLDPYMSSKFYYTVFGTFTIIYAFVFIKTRFDYWEFRYNEVIHRRGFFADIKRYSTEDLRWFKEIPDVLERILAGSGRMILTTPRESHPIVLPHVLRIGSIDEKVADILGTKRVTIT